MREVTKVLAATDGTGHGRAAVVTGAALASRAGATFEIATVVEVLLLPPSPPGVDPRDLEPGFVREVREKASEQASEAGAADALVHVRAGVAPKLVNKIAEDADADMIVLGASPQPARSRSLVGATGRRILYLADRPVLVANSARREPFKRVLAAVDLSEESGPVLESAWAVAKSEGAQMRALFVVEPLPMMLAKVVRQNEDERREAGRQELENILEREGLGSDVEPRVRDGAAGEMILEESQDWDGDLIVIGTHGFGFFDRLMLGSTSLYVLRHGHRATLVVPATGAGE